METKTIIKSKEIPLGSMLVLKNGNKAIVKGYMNSMLPTIDEIYEFHTDIGVVFPKQVEKIIIQGNKIFK